MSTLTDEQMKLADMVIGPERRERLINRYADQLALKYGMDALAARRYATSVYEAGATEMLLAVGQVWAKREGYELPAEQLFIAATGKREGAYTVAGFQGAMVDVGHGTAINYTLFANMWLVAWPEEHQLPKDEVWLGYGADGATDGDVLADRGVSVDPEAFGVIAQREAEFGKPMPEWLPLIGGFYQAANIHLPQHPPCYVNVLDIPAYLDHHLADYRAGWSDFRDQYRPGDGVEYFNAYEAPCECDSIVAAYLGHWLWQRVRADAASEYGGNVGDYMVMFEWAASHADAVLAVAPYADPAWELPADHRLAQCDGQGSLLDPLPEERP
jgi:hypothetical protein